MDLSHTPWNRLLCAEPLEGRWLLSAPATSPAPADAAGAGEAVTEIGLEREEEEGHDGDQEIAPSQLPKTVVDAFEARFPSADVTDAEVEHEGEGIQYGVTAEHDGQTIDVTLTPDGQIDEIEEYMPPASLPPAVLEWLRERFPELAEIVEAAVSTRGDVETYEIAFTDAKDVEWEVELSFSPPTPAPEPPSSGGGEDPGEAPASPPPAPTPSAPQPIAPPAMAGGTGGGAARDADAIALDAATQEQATDGRPIADSPGEHPNASRLSADPRDDAASIATPWAALAAAGPATRVAQALEALAAGRGAAVWLPQVAGVLGDVLTIDVAAVERGLDEVLREIDGLTRDLLGRGDDASADAAAAAAHRLAALAAVAAGLQLLLLRYKKTKGGPVVVFNGARSSWGWVLGTATPTRPTRSWFRQ